MLPLLYRCVHEDHGESWGDFWLLTEEVASQPVRHLLKRFGVDQSEAEDVIQEIFFLLQAHGMRKLRSFQGNTETQLAAWLKRIAVNHTLNWLDKHCRRQQREQDVLAKIWPSDAHRSSEHKLFELLHDLKANLSNREIDKLEILAGVKMPPRPIAERTLRRWRRQLRERSKAS